MPRRRLTRAEMQERTRAALVEAAYRLFERGGFSSVSLDEIAEEAGYSKGAVYSNFRSKEDLFLYLLEREQPGIPDASMFDDESLSVAQQFEEFGRRAIPESSPRKRALSLEMRACALRSRRARKLAGDRMRDFYEAFGKLVDERAVSRGTAVSASGLELVMMMQVIIDGLIGLRPFLPDLVTDEFCGKTMRLLAHLVDDSQPK